MPARQPFTQLCQAISRPATLGRADLHLHSLHSDGVYTPHQIVDLACRAGLSAIAITDHDTLAGVLPTRRLAPPSLEIVSGVEITSEFNGKEIHLLGYFVDPEDGPLNHALESLRHSRRERFESMVEQLHALGVRLPSREMDDLSNGNSLGRRNLAELLVRHHVVGTVREAFQKYLGDHGRLRLTKRRLPAGDAIDLIHGAGGVASWAHPTYDGCRPNLQTLARLGLDAIEVDFPTCRPSRQKHLRDWASELGLAVTAGSDCHGPDQPTHAIGSCTLNDREWKMLKELVCSTV